MDMEKLNVSHTASPVAQDKKGRVQDLGGGSCSKNLLQSPSSGLPSGVTDVKGPLVSQASGGQDGSPVCSGGVASQHPEKQVEKPVPSFTPASGSGGAGATITASVGGVVSGQHHTDAGMGGSGLTRSQRRNIRKKARKAVSNQPPAETTSSEVGFKRPRSEGTTPSPMAQGTAKRSRKDLPPSSYASAVSGHKLAIIREDFPTARLNANEVALIQDAILDRTDAITDGTIPKIFSHFLQKGALIVLCGDEVTTEWLRRNFHDNKEVLGIALKVVNAADLPKPVKVAIRTRNVRTMDHGVFLRRLSVLNPGIDATEWRVLQVVAEEHSVRWILEVDQEDVRALRSRDLMVLTGLDRSHVKILHDPNKKEQQPETDAALQDKDTLGDDVEDASEDASSSPSQKVSSIDSSLDALADLGLDSSSDRTIQQGSPTSLSELEASLQDMEEGDSVASSPPFSRESPPHAS